MTFIVKFSPSVCVAIVASLTREVAVRSFAYHARGRNPAISMAMTKRYIGNACLLRLAPR